MSNPIQARMLRGLLLLVLALGLGCRTDRPGVPRARAGVLDLAAYNLDTQQPLSLDGAWAVHWGQLLSPEQLRDGGGPVADGYLALPSDWKDARVAGRAIGRTGYGTLHLRLLPGAARELLNLKLTGLGSAYRLWADGRMLADGGRVGRNEAEEVVDSAVRLVQIRPQGRPVDLVLQVSNFHLHNAQFAAPVLGRDTDLAADLMRTLGLGLLVAGTLVVAGSFHLVQYLVRRANHAPLCFGVYCLLWTGNILCNGTSGWAIRVFAPDCPGELLFRTYEICYFLAIAVGYQFLRSLYPAEFPRWILRACWALACVYTAMALAGPTQVLSRAMPLFHLLAGVKVLFSVWALGWAVRRGREGALLILVGFACLGAASLNDILNGVQVLHTGLVLHLGLLGFLLSQNLALSLRHSHLVVAVDRLSGEVLDQELTLMERTAEKARLEGEVAAASEAERRRISQDLHDGLCQQLTGARMQLAVLQGMEPGDDRLEELKRLSALLEASSDQAYDLSHGLWTEPPRPEETVEAITDLARRTSRPGGAVVAFQPRLACATCRNQRVTSLYGIAREAIANALKHARPGRIQVELDCLSGCGPTLTVQDDGQGQGPANPGRGLGLRMMAHAAREADGQLRIERGPGGGVRVVCSVPCASRETPA